MTHKNELALTHDYTIRSYEPRMDGHVSITSTCNQLQDMASRHADALGFGLKDLQKSGHLWLLARLHVMMDTLPRYGDSVEVTTWPSGNERLVALRDFTIQQGATQIGCATTSWVTMNKETHRPDAPSTVLDERLIPDREHALIFPTKAVKRLKDGEHSVTLTSRRCDTDINGHVNNVRYTEFCLEAVPEAWDATHRCHGLDIQFRSESFPGDSYISSCSMAEPDNGMETMLHSLTREEDGKEIVRMRSWWKGGE